MSQKSNDPIVENLVKKLRERSLAGQEKYGQTLQDEVDKYTKNFLDYITDVEEELADALLYIAAFKQCMREQGLQHRLFRNEDE